MKSLSGFNDMGGLLEMQQLTPHGASGPTTLILDNCTDTDGTNVTSHTIAPTNVPGNPWTLGQGTATIQGNRIKAGTGATNVNNDVGQSDVTISSIVNDGGAPAFNGVVARYSDTANFWELVYNQGTGEFSIYEFSTANGVVQRATTSVSKSSSVDLTFQLVCSGSTLTGTLDGANSINYGSATNNQAKTVHGLRGANTACKFDDPKITQP